MTSAHTAVALLRRAVVSKTERPEEEKARAGVRTVVRSILTSGLYLLLIHGKNGVNIVAEHLQKTSIETPTIVWNSTVRRELLAFVKRNRDAVRGYPSWSFNEDTFSYAALRHEPVWDNVYLRLYAKQELGYQFPQYLQISKAEFYHSLLKMLGRFSQEHSLVHDRTAAPARTSTSEAKSDSAMLVEPPKTERSLSRQVPALHLPEGTDPLDYATVLVRCVLHTLRSAPKLHERKERGLADLMRLVVHPHARLQDSVLRVVLTCKGQDESMRHACAVVKWVVCMLHSSERSGDSSQPSPELVLDALSALVEYSQWPDNIQPPPGAKTFAQMESELVTYGLPILLSLVICSEKKTPDFARPVRVRAARLCGLLSAGAQTATYRALYSIFSWQIGRLLRSATSKPDALIAFFDELKQDPRVYWTEAVRREIMDGVRNEADKLLRWQRSALGAVRKGGREHEPCTWDAKGVGMRVRSPTLAQQLCVGETFVFELVQFPHYKLDAQVYLPPLFKVLEEWHKRRSDDGRVDEKVVGALIDSLNIVVTNLPQIADSFLDRMQFLYSFLEFPQRSIREKTLEVLCACAKEKLPAMKAAQLGLVRYAAPLLENAQSEDIMERVLLLLLDLTRRSSPVVRQITDLGAHLLLILIIMRKVRSATDRLARLAATLIGAMTNDGYEGDAAAARFCAVLTPAFKDAFQKKDVTVVHFFSENHEHKGRSWDATHRAQVVALLQDQVQPLVKKMPTWDCKTSLFDDNLVFRVWPKPPTPEPAAEPDKDQKEGDESTHATESNKISNKGQPVNTTGADDGDETTGTSQPAEKDNVVPQASA